MTMEQGCHTQRKNIRGIQGTGTVQKIVLTGGPCGGKTTVQAMLSDTFENIGWKVYKVGETATFLLGAGVNFAMLTDDAAFQFQSNLLKVMIAVEDTFTKLAESHAEQGVNTIIICDRGAMDPSAYCPRENWSKILDIVNFHDIELRDQRYNMVVHLVTAAIGAEKFYNTENNNVRSEGVELAAKLDRRIAEAWMGHPYFHVIDNSTSFDVKLQRVVETILKHLGLEDARGGKTMKRKFLVKDFDLMADIPVGYQDFEVEHRYLVSVDDTQTRIRKRGNNGNFAYTLTIRKMVNGQRIETRRILRSREYEALSTQQDPSRCTIKKHRRCFLYNQRYYHIDVFKQPSNGLVLLEAYLNVGEETLPPFLNIVSEVTDDSAYSMFTLAAK